MIFYITYLIAINTLELNSNEITLRLSGEFNKEIILKNLKKYIKNVIIENKPKSYSYCHLFNNVPIIIFTNYIININANN